MTGDARELRELLGLAQLLRLASPALPIGAFAWSSGLEGAIDQGLVTGEASAEAWIGDALVLGQGRWEAPILWRMLVDAAARERLDARYRASRETHELRAETLAMGAALMKLVRPPEGGVASLPLAWALAAEAWGVAPGGALLGWLVAFVESQLAVVQKTLPIGQSAAQRCLCRLLPVVAAVHARAMALPEDDWSSALPGLAIASARHETQYSRLFRS